MAPPLQLAIMPETSSSPLERLPTELLDSIAEDCGPKLLGSLIRCSKTLYNRLYPTMLASEVTKSSGTIILWAVSHGSLALLQTLCYHYGFSATDNWGRRKGPLRSRRQRRNDPDRKNEPLARSELHRYGLDSKCDFKISFSLLHLAAAEGHDHIIAWLVDQGCDLQSTTGTGQYWCLQAGHTQGICDPFKTTATWTPLELAICRGHVSSARWLIERGAAAFAAGEPGRKVFHMAVQHGCYEVVELLLQSGYDVNEPSFTGQLPINITAARWHCRQDLHSLRVLLQAGPNLTAESTFVGEYNTDDYFYKDYAVTPLHHAIGARAYEAALLLLEDGADATTLSGGWAYPLHCALLAVPRRYKSHEHNSVWLRLIQALLVRGADPNFATGTNGITPLMLAARYSPRPEALGLLLRSGADVNAVDRTHKQNALQWAVYPYIAAVDLEPGVSPDPEIVDIPLIPSEFEYDLADRSIVARLLLENGCSSGKKNALGHCALRHWSMYQEAWEPIEVILEYHKEQCVAPGCLDETFRACLRTGRVKNAGWLRFAGAALSESIMLEEMHRYFDEPPEFHGSLQYDDIYRFLGECHDMAVNNEILSDRLEEYIAGQRLAFEDSDFGGVAYNGLSSEPAPRN